MLLRSCRHFKILTSNFHLQNLTPYNPTSVPRPSYLSSRSIIKMSSPSASSLETSNPPSSFCPSTTDSECSPAHKKQKLSNAEESIMTGESKKPNGNVYKKQKNQKQKKSSDPNSNGNSNGNPTFPLEQPEGFAENCPKLSERISKTDLSFENTLTLAPMVRIGSLPTRLLSLEYGADLVWGPEVIDRAIISTTRVIDPKTGLIEWVKGGKQIFSTHPIERSRVIFQLGSASPELASQAIKKICETSPDRSDVDGDSSARVPDVAAVCLNCGCPKHFSTHGGMGANLLYTPDLLCSILVAMRKEAPSSIAVHAKIRLLPSQRDTLALVRAIVRTNAVDCITVHCRTKDMRPREPALPHRMREIIEEIMRVGEGKVKVGCNGDAWDADEAFRIKELTGVTSVMIARGAEANPSVFRPLSEGGPVSVPDVIMPKWIRYHTLFNNPISNTKYCVSALSYSNQPFHFTSGPPVQSRIEAKNQIIKVPQLSSHADSKKWTKEKLKNLRLSITASKTTSEFQTAIGMKEEDFKAETEGDWKSALASLGQVMQQKFNWDWIQETEKVIQEGRKLQEIRLKEQEEMVINGEESTLESLNAIRDGNGNGAAENKGEEVANQSHPPETTLNTEAEVREIMSG